MSIPNKRARTVRPTHPGVMLREDFLPEYGLTVSGFAQALKVSRQTVNELLRERRALSPEMALRLSRLFGNSPEFWLNAQRAVDLWEAAKKSHQTPSPHIGQQCLREALSHSNCWRHSILRSCLLYLRGAGHRIGPES